MDVPESAGPPRAPRPGRTARARRGIATGLLALLLLEGSPIRAQPPTEAIAAQELTRRVEAWLARPQTRLDLGHAALIRPVDPDTLDAFVAQVRVFGRNEREFVLGTDYGPELHGGATLALLWDHWRPEGRRPVAEDRIFFPRSGVTLALGDLQAAHRHHVYLPAAEGKNPAALPRSPALARMQLPRPGGRSVDVDAWAFLRMAAFHEPDLSRSWTNARGQRLSAETLLDHARRVHRTAVDVPGEPEDHGRLHLVEILLADARRRQRDPHEIQQRFVRVELARREFDPDDEALLLGHHAESLGRLLAEPRVSWSADDRARARRWLAWLVASRFRDLAKVEPSSLAHLLLGLRLVREHAGRLEPDA
jgi:hypothetical protein